MKIEGLYIKPHIMVDWHENSLVLLGICRKLLRLLNIKTTEITRFTLEATSGDREHLIGVVESVFECQEEPAA